jgi:hypothetical protein
MDAVEEFSACWEGLEYPRTANAGLHDFNELRMIVLCTVVRGGQGAVEKALFAKAKKPYPLSFLKPANGVQSHDTFSRLFRQLCPAQYSAALRRCMRWTPSVGQVAG